LYYKEKITPIVTKELDMLETYFNEIVAAVLILIIIIIYFIIKKSKQKKEDFLEKSIPTPNKQKLQKQKIETIVKEEMQEEEKEEEPLVMQNIVETINFDSLSGGEEGSFGVEEASIKNNTTDAKQPRVKRVIPPNTKITRSDFKEFAGIRILLAEDNIINQKVILGLLADSGIEVKVADDGQFLLEMLEKDSNYNFILMDAHMPRVDGLEASRKIRKNPDYDHIIIISLSGDTANDDIKKMAQAGMQEHLQKPLRMESLYEILYAYNDSTQTIPEEFVEIVITDELDTNQGLNICGDDVNFYYEILNEFVNTYSVSPAKLQEFLNKNQMKQADKYLLDLSGITANIGANHISKIALDLKKAIVDTKDKKYIELFDEYAKSLHVLLEDIKKYKN
jgi:CheY-like chemotaxis protein